VYSEVTGTLAIVAGNTVVVVDTVVEETGTVEGVSASTMGIVLRFAFG